MSRFTSVPGSSELHSSKNILPRSHTFGSKMKYSQSVLSQPIFSKRSFMDGLKTIRSKLISYKPRRQQLFYIFHMILNQRRLSYNTCLALCYYFRCFACRKERSLKRKSSSKQDFYLDQGIRKLNRDLDINNLLEMV